ncbi:fimbria/pilus outer membrane usher protein, partial [Lelliottia nimipressuralis]
MKTFILASALVSSYSQAAANDSAFDADFLRKDSQELPEQFYHPDQVDAGVKTADIVLNGHILFKTKVEFIATKAGESATPCLTQALLHQTGLDTHLDELAKARNETCYDFLKKWPDARISYDESMQQLVISAPQAATSVAGQTEMIDPSLWDNGVNALRLGYSGYVYHTDNHSEDSGSGSSDNAYLSLNSGVNLGSWRFYSFDTFNKSDLGWEQFTVPYTALPNMLRPGTWRYSLSAGRYRDDGLSCQPLVAQGSLQYGWDRFTLSDLIVAGEGYQSMALSSAVNLGVLGSVSLDWALERHQSATDSDNTGDEDISDNGRALRLLYARRFDSTDTSLQVMGFRYQSKDFMDFPDYASWRWGDSNTRSHRKNEVQATLNQGMGDFGNGYLTLQQDSYYDSDARDTSLTLGYSFMIKFVNVSLNYSYQKNSGAGDDSDDDRQFSLNLSIPLDAGDRNSRTLSVSTNSSNHDSGSQMATVSGTELDNALSYSLSAQHDSSGYSPAASMAYRNSMVNMNV